jgi:hypothetical protein
MSLTVYSEFRTGQTTKNNSIPKLDGIRIALCKGREVGILAMKHLETTRRVINPDQQGLVNHWKRVLRSQQ